MEDTETLISLTADIVAAHVANNSVSISDVPKLVANVHEALAGLGSTQEQPKEERREPAVSVRSSVKPDSITCLICGKKQKTLKRHIQNAHGLSPSDYRQEFGLKGDYPMVAPEYSERRSEMAKSIGLGNKRQEAPKRGTKLKS